MGVAVAGALLVVVALLITVSALVWRRRVRRLNFETPVARYQREIREIQRIRDRVTARRGYGSGASATGISDYSGGGFGGHGGGCGGHGC